MTIERSTRLHLALLLAAFGLGAAPGGCIGDDLWQQYNLDATGACQLDDECQSGICRGGRCQSSSGAVGLNCRDDQDCDSSLCVVLDGHAQGICFDRCSSSDPRCVPQAACYQVTMSVADETAKDHDICLLRCLTDSDCDTFGRCVLYEGSTEGYCLPR